MVVQLERFCVSCSIKAAKATGSDKLLGEDDRQAQYLVELGGKEGVGIVCFFGEAAKELLIHLRRGHQRIEAELSDSLELGHLVSLGSKNVECRNCGESFRSVDVKNPELDRVYHCAISNTRLFGCIELDSHPIYVIYENRCFETYVQRVKV